MEKRLVHSSVVQKDHEDDYGHVNVSLSAKLRRISLVKKQKGTDKDPSYKKTTSIWKGTIEDDLPSENESPPPSKSRRTSLVKRVNMKTQSPAEETINHERRPASRLVDTCKELVNLAVSRGSLDDITVMIIDLNQFKCNS